MKSRSKIDGIRRAWCLGLATTMTVGCGPDAGAWLYYLFPPRVDVKAEFKLPPGPLLVLVDLEGDSPVANIGGLIADRLATELREHKVNDRILSSRRLDELRQIEPEFETMGPVKIGSRLEADTVLWLKVRIESSRRVGGTEVISGLSCNAEVRVINAQAKERQDIRLWPAGRPDGPGKIVSAEIDVHQARAAESPEARARLLSEILVDKVAKQFYDHVITVDNYEPGT